jgi:glycerol-3-phosphate O-acyltransferase
MVPNTTRESGGDRKKKNGERERRRKKIRINSLFSLGRGFVNFGENIT